ncbi:adenylyl-sulfate kinase [Nocardia gipuzkoensis]
MRRGSARQREGRYAAPAPTGALAAMIAESGQIVFVAAIGPLAEYRDRARRTLFHEVHVDTPLAECEQRDPKGLHAKARARLIPDFTGIDGPLRSPANPDLRLMPGLTVAELATEIVWLVVAAPGQAGGGPPVPGSSMVAAA